MRGAIEDRERHSHSDALHDAPQRDGDQRDKRQGELDAVEARYCTQLAHVDDPSGHEQQDPGQARHRHVIEQPGGRDQRRHHQRRHQPDKLSPAAGLRYGCSARRAGVDRECAGQPGKHVARADRQEVTADLVLHAARSRWFERTRGGRRLRDDHQRDDAGHRRHLPDRVQ